MDVVSLLYERLALWVVLVLSLSVHEWAHAWMANRLGDDTARHGGRLSLDPLVHLDLLGTVILPLMGVPFGWAKPVPVEPLRFRREHTMVGGLLQTALAGPVSNLMLAAGCATLLAASGAALGAAGRSLLDLGLQVNVGLAIVNLLPIPPLDGSRVVEGLLPASLRPLYDRVAPLGPVLILAAGAGLWLARLP